MAEYETFFDEADTNGNGFLTFDELKAALQGKGYSEEGIQTMFDTVDQSGDSKVTKEEFLSAMGAAPPVYHKGAAMMKMFKGFDTDGTGKITGADLKKVWQEDFGRILTQEEMDTLIDRIEGAGGDDEIDYEEFVKYFSDKNRV